MDTKDVVRVLARGTLYRGVFDAITCAIRVGAYGGAPLSIGDIKNGVLAALVGFEEQWNQGSWVEASKFDENFLIEIVERDKRETAASLYGTDGKLVKEVPAEAPAAQITPEEIERLSR